MDLGRSLVFRPFEVIGDPDHHISGVRSTAEYWYREVLKGSHARLLKGPGYVKLKAIPVRDQVITAERRNCRGSLRDGITEEWLAGGLCTIRSGGASCSIRVPGERTQECSYHRASTGRDQGELIIRMYD